MTHGKKPEPPYQRQNSPNETLWRISLCHTETGQFGIPGPDGREAWLQPLMIRQGKSHMTLAVFPFVFRATGHARLER